MHFSHLVSVYITILLAIDKVIIEYQKSCLISKHQHIWFLREAKTLRGVFYYSLYSYGKKGESIFLILKI